MGKARATKASKIELSEVERETLDRLVRRRKVARGDAQRAEIVLRAAEGLNNCEIAAAVGVTQQTVRTWRERFAKHRLDGLDDEPRCGAPRKIGDDCVEEIVTRTLETQPEKAMSHKPDSGALTPRGSISSGCRHRLPLSHRPEAMQADGDGGPSRRSGWNEEIADCGEDVDEMLQPSPRSEPLHRSLALS